MKIEICPVKGLYRIPAEGRAGSCAALISSAGAIDEARLRGVPHIFRQYEDLDRECPGRSFSRADAAAFGDFVKHLDGGTDTLYCCCDAGQSRSPAVAAAVMRYFGMDDMPVWRDPRYRPNLLVFDMLTEELGVAVSDNEKDLRFYTSRNAFRAAVRGAAHADFP